MEFHKVLQYMYYKINKYFILTILVLVYVTVLFICWRMKTVYVPVQIGIYEYAYTLRMTWNDIWESPEEADKIYYLRTEPSKAAAYNDYRLKPEILLSS